MNLKPYIVDINKDYDCVNCYSICPYKRIIDENINKCTRCGGEITELYKRYGCDICNKGVVNYELINGNVVEKIDLHKDDNGICFVKYHKYKDACVSCFNEKSLEEITDIEKLKERYDTIKYEIEYESKNNGIDAYVIYEYNNCSSNQFCQYYLLCLKDGKIILNWIIDTYNPYFGVSIKDCIIEDYFIKISYREKHYLCNVTLEYDNDNDDEYVKYGIYNYKPTGKVLEFIKGENVMESKRYR